MNILNELKYRILYATPVVRLIIVNVAVFVITGLWNVFYFLATRVNGVTTDYLALPSHYHYVLMRPWTLLTHQFLHSNLLHIFFNMFALYVVGGIFQDFFRKKDVWRVYILGGSIGAVFYILANVFIPAFQGQSGMLMGASGGVMAILFATATYAPNLRLNLFGVFPVKLIWIALAYLLIDMLSLPGSNWGGHIAHIGGAAFGWIFANFRKGKLQFRLFEPATPNMRVTGRQEKVSVNHPRPASRAGTKRSGQAPTQEEIDAILDKISKSGYERLTKEEKDILFKASQD